MVNDKYYIIDSHCHIYPEKIATLAKNHTDEFYSENSVGKGTVSDLIERGKSAGVDKFIVQSVATVPKQVRKINEFIANEVKNNDCFVGLGTMHPESEDIIGDLNHLKELGLKGVKIHPDIQGFCLDCEGYQKMYEYCQENGLIVLMHTGDYRYDYSNPNRLKPLLEKYKNLKVIGAHFGGWSVYEDASRELCGYENFYVDCSSSFAYFDNESALKYIRRYGVDKVLFATDYPMWDAKSELERFFSLGLSEEDNKKILSLNAKKLFNI